MPIWGIGKGSKTVGNKNSPNINIAADTNLTGAAQKKAFKTVLNKITTIIPRSDYVTELMGIFRSPYLYHTAPWNFNGDSQFLTTVYHNPEIANAFDLRTNLVLTTDYGLDWDGYMSGKIKKPAREGSEEILRYALGKSDLDWYFKLVIRAIQTGKEGINHLFEEITGITCPIEMEHIDHRRIVMNKVEYPDSWRYEPFIQMPVGINEIPMYNDQGENVLPNFQLLVYRAFEHTRGEGEGLLNSIYWTLRFLNFVERLSQVGVEKFSLPMIIASLMEEDNSFPTKTDGEVDGPSTFDVMDELEDTLNESAAANFIGIPYNLKIDLLDVAGDNRLNSLREWMVFLLKRCTDRILGSSGIVDSETASYGSTKAVSAVSVRMMANDRKFMQKALQWLIGRLWELNEPLRKLIPEKCQLPIVRLHEEDHDKALELEKLTTLSTYKEYYIPTKDELQRITSIELEKAPKEQEPDPNQYKTDTTGRNEPKQNFVDRKDRDGAKQ